MKFIDLTGQRFGSLVAQKYLGNGSWLCVCDCGNEKIAFAANLKKGNTWHCGCKKVNIFKDLTGQRFGRLIVISRAENNKWGNIQYLCKCDCGTEKVINAQSLKKGYTTSCGCYRRERPIVACTIHGLRHIRLYHAWSTMCRNCLCNNGKQYKYYGGRGITVCDEWKNDFKTFYDWAIANGYKEEILPNGTNKWIIKRIDNNGNFEPDNCCVVTAKEKTYNKSHTKKITYRGLTLTVKQTAEKYDIPYTALSKRLNDGWEIQKAIETPVKAIKRYEYKGELLSIQQISEKYGIKPQTLYSRITYRGMTVAEAIETPIGTLRAKRNEAKRKKKITQAQFDELNKLEENDHKAYNKKLKKLFGITAQPYSAYEYYRDGKYVGNSYEDYPIDLLNEIGVEIEKYDNNNE